MARSRYPSVKKGADGNWHAYVVVGTKPNGRPDQRHVKRATRGDVEDQVDALLEQRRAGTVIRPGDKPSVEQWLTVYLDTVAPLRCDPGTVRDYRSLMTHWVLPTIGRTRLHQLRPEQLEQVYLSMQRAGKPDSTVLKVHRILKRAIEIAYRRSLVPRNVAALIDSPTTRAVEMKPLTEADARAVLTAAAGHRNSARWSVGLALGLRQGEVLGLRWEYVELDSDDPHLKVWWQLRRRAFEHGCSPACGKRRGGNCPQRQLAIRSGEHSVLDLSKPRDADRRTGLIMKEPKGKSRRTVPLPPELVEQLRAHREVQELERKWASGVWQRHDFVFARPDGQPVDPSHDFAEWKAILAAAGVRDARVHDARHTAATLLLAQGVDVSVVQEILGHSDVRVTRGYAHVASAMAKDATARIGSSLLGRSSTP